MRTDRSDSRALDAALTDRTSADIAPALMERMSFMGMVFGMMAAKTVAAAAELGILDLLAGGPQTSEQLAERARADPAAVRRVSRAMTGIGTLVQVGPDRFELSQHGRYLLSGVPGSMRPFILTRCAPEFWQAWGELVDSIRTGQTAWDLAHGMSWLDYYQHHPDRWQTFNSHMSQHTRDAAPAIATAIDFSRFRSIVDIGGGDGTLVAEILRKHPDLRGVVFDLPEVVSAAPANLAAAGVADRAEVTPGDFFAAVHVKADAYLMKFILHDWDDERAVTILRNCRDAMSAKGRLLVVERVLPEEVTTADMPDLLSDILMLVATGGKERTADEYRAILDAAGFDLTTLSQPLPPFDYRVIEAAPADGNRRGARRSPLGRRATGRA